MVPGSLIIPWDLAVGVFGMSEQKPPGLGGTDDELWWIRQKLRREELSVLPPALALRKELDDYNPDYPIGDVDALGGAGVVAFPVMVKESANGAVPSLSDTKVAVSWDGVTVYFMNP